MNFTPNPAFVANFLAAPPQETVQIIQRHADTLTEAMRDQVGGGGTPLGVLWRAGRPLTDRLIDQREVAPATIVVGLLEDDRSMATTLKRKAVAERAEGSWVTRSLRIAFPDWNI